MMSYFTHTSLICELGRGEGREFNQVLVEAGRLEDHQHPPGLSVRKRDRMRDARWDMDRGGRGRRDPAPVEIEIDVAVQNVERLRMRAVHVQAERKLPLEIVFHQRVGAARIRGRDFYKRMIARPIATGATARRHHAICGHRRPLGCAMPIRQDQPN
jgi:hypothetical protein